MNTDGHIIVGERLGQRLTVINKAGKKIKSLKKDKLSCPRGVAITPDNCLIIADDQTIKKISMDEKLIAQRGDDKQNLFNFPWGVAVSPQTGDIYVADSNNHIVQVLNSTLKYQFLFGKYGQTSGKFESPHFLTVHNQEASYLYVSSNHCIQKFTLSGKFISQFGTEGSGPGQLHSPEGIAVTDNYVYIADWGNDRISVFTTDGKFVRCFGSKGINKDQFQSPRGIATDSEGHLYICDFGNNRIVVY
jgi:tripartite motif-containing protein 2/3/tripartite motif-containing protein 71